MDLDYYDDLSDDAALQKWPSAASQDILGNSLWIASRPEGVFSLASRPPTQRQNARFDENPIALVKLH